MSLTLGLAQAHRQNGLGAFERLNLRFLVDAQDDRVVRWVHVQANNVAHLFDKLWVFDFGDFLDGTDAHVDFLEIGKSNLGFDGNGFDRFQKRLLLLPQG